ncbi:hypothetical protein EYF80_020814 [Liparis tanakae]|uniref:Secreted protein n=1 Tax=Liparis tanakae TaxID=230148 RepID=A0A4Z2HVF9_9TELE|nr:hypothetical protein EYF80_020814 [Liparis tanakae]
MAFTASWMRLLTLLRTFGPAGVCIFRDGVEPLAPPLEGWEVGWSREKHNQMGCNCTVTINPPYVL